MTSVGLFAFCTTLKKLNTLMANLLLRRLNCSSGQVYKIDTSWLKIRASLGKPDEFNSPVTDGERSLQ